jgi:hypothetical protein
MDATSWTSAEVSMEGLSNSVRAKRRSRSKPSKETTETPAGVQGYIVWHYFVVFGESMYAWDGAGIQTYAFSDDAEGSNGDTMDERYARVGIDGRTMMFKGFGNSTPQQQNQPVSSFFGDDGITA